MKRILMVALVGLLQACETTGPKVVDVPVVVSCLKGVPVRPDYETKRIDQKASDGQKVAALSRDWVRSRKYEGQLEASIEGCKQ